MKLSPSTRFVNIAIHKSLPTCSMRTNSLLMLSRLKYALLMILMRAKSLFNSDQKRFHMLLGKLTQNYRTEYFL